MKCPSCSGDTYVTETRTVGGTLRRRRVCSECLNKFFTLEAPERVWEKFKVYYAHECKAVADETEQKKRVIEAVEQIQAEREQRKGGGN